MTLPDLDDFRQAAARGPWVWIEETGSARAVQGGGEPTGQGLADVGALFVAALRERFGAAASAVAERQLDLHEGWRQPLPSATVSRALRCAEGAQALLAARAFMLHFEFSAQLLGVGFQRVCAGLGVDAHALPPERREALDHALAPLFARPDAPSRDEVQAELRRQLQQPQH